MIDALWGWPPPVLDPAGPYSAKVTTLSWSLFALGAIVTAVVVAALWVAIKGPDRWKAKLGGEPAIWIGGVAFPGVVLTALLVWGLTLTASLTEPIRGDEMRIRVTGEMWWFRVQYLDAAGNVAMEDANEIHIPVGEPVVLELLPLFAEAAPSDTAGALSGREDVSLAVVVIQATQPEVFRSAKADINEVYGPLVGSIAQVIRDNIEFIGAVRVVGHTDSIPVQTSNPFRSNQGLSEARAKTIADMLVAAGVPAGLVISEGKAATEPIADNGTREGRARNRRVEIILQKKV